MDKKKIIEYLQGVLAIRISEIEKAIKNAQDSANGESKSSAGDKYETARAMAQNDILMYSTQLYEAQRDKNLLDGINLDQPFETIKNGALVLTSLGLFFIALSVGKFTFDGLNIMLVSQQSPIVVAMKGLAANTEFEFNGNKIRIEKIC